MILGGRDLSRENVSAEISHAAQESNAVDAVRVAIGTSVKETDLLHMSYLNACDTIDMNDLSDSPVLLKEETDTLALMLICWQRKYESCITCLTRASGTPVIVISPRSCTSRMERMPR